LAQVVKRQQVSYAPRDHVVGAGGVAAYTETADFLAVFIKREPAAEDVNSADALADHWVFARPEISATQHQLLEAAIGDVGIDRIAVL
jgi:hypothetical protein